MLKSIGARRSRLASQPVSPRVSRGDIEKLRGAGLDDGEILEINQVSSYFAYANRMVLGLGIDTDGDVIGLSPGGSDDPDDWQHA